MCGEMIQFLLINWVKTLRGIYHTNVCYAGRFIVRAGMFNLEIISELHYVSSRIIVWGLGVTSIQRTNEDTIHTIYTFISPGRLFFLCIF